MTEQKTKKSLKMAMPDAFIIIFAILVLAAIATYIIPAGSYEREVVDKITRVVPNSYALTEANPANLLFIFKSIQLGMIQTASIIFLILIIGGIVHVIESTGAINAGINQLIIKTKGNDRLLIASVAGLFGVLASMGLSANVVIAFIPIGITLARSLKLDAITGVATIYLGYYAGMIAGIFDPTILGLAQTIAELPLFSGMPLRVVIFIALISIVIIYTTRYAAKIKKSPELSKMGAFPFGEEDDPELVAKAEKLQLDTNFTLTHKLVFFTFIAFIGFFIWGAFEYRWGVNDLVAIFLMMGVVIALIARISPNEFIRRFIKGAQSLVYGALVVGLARAIIVVLSEGNVMDTIVYAALVPLEATSQFVGAQLLFVFNMLFNLLVTSGSGQAAIVMPIMVPIVDILGITRQTGALAFMLGDGFTNIITPTSGVLMAVLAVGKVKWIDWVRFAFPLLLMWIVVGVIAVGYATLTGYGPF